eukprot:4979389-Amphidinium_carterae.1
MASQCVDSSLSNSGRHARLSVIHCGADELMLELLRAQLTKRGPDNPFGASLGVILRVGVSIKYLLGGRMCAGRAQSGAGRKAVEQTHSQVILAKVS